MNPPKNMGPSIGVVERDSRNEPGQSSLAGQLPHRTNDPLLKSSDSDFPEPGSNPEHSGEKEEEINPEGATQDQDPGMRQKQNQGDKKDDPLAA